MSSSFVEGHALIAGAGGNLPNTVDDAVGIADILRDGERCAYPHQQVRLLTGPEATRSTILDELDAAAGRVTARSTFVFYFSGHGAEVATSIGAKYFFLPSGYDIAALATTAVSGDELARRLGAIPAGKVLVLLDTCHAGGMDQTTVPGLELTKAPLPADRAALLAAGSGRVVIASCRDGELSFAGKPYSAFTLALIEAFAGCGASKRDGYVRVADLAMHTRDMVPRRTHDRQHPILNFERADNFAVAFYAAGNVSPKALPFAGEPAIEPAPGAFAAARGDVVGADKVGGDKIVVGNVTGSGIAIGRNARSSIGRPPDRS